jgi:hypothetical protein
MIKAAEAARRDQKESDPNTRIDALARALGYEYAEGEYSRPMTKTERAVRVKRTYTRKVAAAPKETPATRKRAMRGAQLTTVFYDGVRALEVGQELDVTDTCKGNRISFESMLNRIATFQWQERHNHGRQGVRYTVRREHWRIKVRREA